MGKGCGAEALQDKTNTVTLLRLAQDTEGIVDMALTVADSAQQGRREIIGGENFGKNGVFLAQLYI